MPPTVRHSATALSGALNALRERSSPPRCTHAVPRPRSARIYPDMHGGNDGTRPHPPCASVLNRISHRFLTLFPTPSVSPPHAHRPSSTRVRSSLAWKSWQSFQIGVNSLQFVARLEILHDGSRKLWTRGLWTRSANREG